MELETIIYGPNKAGKWDAEDLACVFSQLVKNGLHDYEVTPRLIEQWATKSAHYGLLALRDLDVQAEGWRVIQGAGGVR